MVAQLETETQKTVWQIVVYINHAWSKGQVGDLRNYLREDMVIVTPGLQDRIVGREACVNSFQEFRNQATIHSYHESDAAVDVFGNMAVATYRWEIVYDMDGQSYQETGGDLFVFVREDAGWQAAWRTLIPDR